jgi:hypothetical protein
VMGIVVSRARRDRPTGGSGRDLVRLVLALHSSEC